jgi:orotate phosphoribosyltransferase
MPEATAAAEGVLEAGAIVGVAVGGVIAVTLVVISMACLVRRRSKDDEVGENLVTIEEAIPSIWDFAPG